MPDINQQRAEAIALVKITAQCEVEPIIDDAELAPIVDQCQRATYWIASATYQVGAVVMPTVLNGHRYRAQKVIGAAASTEPIWPRDQGARIRDGEVTWIEDGPDYNPFYVELAIHLVWMRKLAKAQSCTDWKAGGISNSGNQVFTNLEKMAMLTKPFEVA